MNEARAFVGPGVPDGLCVEHCLEELGADASGNRPQSILAFCAQSKDT